MVKDEELKEKEMTKKRKLEEKKKKRISETKRKQWEEDRLKFYKEKNKKKMEKKCEIGGGETEDNKAFSEAKLPEQIITIEIFSRLPVNSLLRFRSVCKAICCLVKDPYFIKLHITRSNDINNKNNTDLVIQGNLSLLSTFYIFNSIDSDSSAPRWPDWPMKHKLPSEFDTCLLRGSCNGLIYLCGYDNDCYFSVLWNPATREYKRLLDTEPQFKYPPFDSLLESQENCCGLGYDSSSGDFKVLRITTFDTYPSYFHVYTLSSNSWRTIEYITNDDCQSVSMFFLNGALHWTARRSIPPKKFNVLMSFSIKEEKFGEVPQPNFNGGEFGVLRGFLSLVHRFFNNRVEIWIMKDYGVKESWTKMFAITHPLVTRISHYHALIFLKNDEALFAKDYNEVIRYNLKNGMIKQFLFYGLNSWRAFTCIGSLVSLNTVNTNEKTKVIMGSSVKVYEESRVLMDELSVANYDAR